MKSLRNKNWKLKGIIMMAVMLSLLAFPPSAAAQENPLDANLDGNLSVSRCLAKGNLEFITFMQSLIWSDGFGDAYIEPWLDVTTRNQCQANDIVGLINQRDKIRSYIRDAFLTCNTQKLPNMKRAFNEVNAEIYYARNIVDGAVVANLPFDLLTTRSLEDEAGLYTARKVIYNDMVGKYVENGQFTPAKFDEFFARIELKYKDRKKNYVICENSSWAVVSEKWEEFIDTAGGVTPAWNKLEKGVGGRVEKISEAATDTTYGGYFESIVQLNINNQEAKPGFAEITDDFAKAFDIPDFSTSAPTYDLVLGAVDAVDFQFEIDTARTTLSSRFETLYKDTSDNLVENMVTELDLFNKVILDGLPLIDKVENCVETMNDRQCAGK